MPGQGLEPVKKGLTMDGAVVYILDEEWKGVKVSCVFDSETCLEYCRRTKERKEVVKAKNHRCVACLGEPEPFAKLLSAEAEPRGYDQAQDRACVGDAAKWIWNLSSHCFPTAGRIVDWNHAVEHSWTAAHLAENPDSTRLNRWVKGRRDELWPGHPQTVSADIEALADDNPTQVKELHTEAGYFRRTARRMQYQEFHEEGYPTGSGTVESACKQLLALA